MYIRGRDDIDVFNTNSKYINTNLAELAKV